MVIEVSSHSPGEDQFFNPQLSNSSNTFINRAIEVGLTAITLCGGDELKAGRLAYEMLAKEFAGKTTAIDFIVDHIVPSRSKESITIRHYSNKDATPGKVIFFAHGGGWSRGSLDTHDELCRQLCQSNKAVVFSVDYALAPENPYPHGLNDIEDALFWVIANQKKRGLEIDSLTLAGDSGGGNLVTCLMVRLIKAKSPLIDLIKNLVLIYPALDLRTDISNTTKTFDENCFLTRDRVEFYVNNYLGDENLKSHDEVSPILASDDVLGKFPPTIIVSAGSDPLLAQAEEFLALLKKNGRETSHLSFPYTIHIFAQFFGLFDEAQESIKFIQQKLG